MKLIDLLIHSTRRHPDRLACVHKDQQLTYRQLLSHVQTLADQLRHNGCHSGKVVALMFPNTPELFIAFFAASATGACLFPLASSYTPSELSRYLAQLPCDLLLTSPSQIEKTRSLSIAATRSLSLIANQCATHYYKTNNKNQYHDPILNDVALLSLTSGSTGPVKTAMLTHKNLIKNMRSFRQAINLTGVQKALCVLPLHHIYPICAQLLTHISRADTLILNTQPFMTNDFFQTVKSHQVSITALVPYQGQLLAEATPPENKTLSSLKTITFSGAKTPLTLYSQLVDNYPTIQFINMYGMTEAGSRIALSDPLDHNTPTTSVGKPLPSVQLKIINASRDQCPTSTTGQIILKSPGVMKGYYNQTDLTNQTITNGWLATGDLGYLDNQGYLYITGRIKNMILSAGNNISPEEIEDCLIAHPQISQAAVVAQKHPRLEEVPCAFIVSRQQQVPLESKQVIQHCRNRLSPYKVPLKIIFVDDLPKLSNTKINRRCLQRWANKSL